MDTMCLLLIVFVVLHTRFCTREVNGYEVNKTDIFHQYSLLCGPNFNNSQVNVWGFPPVANELSVCPICNPNPDCVVFHNCCPDTELGYQVAETTRGILYAANSTFSKYQLYEIISTCPQEANSSVAKLCKEQRDLEEQLQYPPVTDENNNVYFKNQYCALCNNVINYTPWILDSTCQNTFDYFNSFSALLSTAAKQECILKHRPPTIHESVYTCTYLIDECNVTGTWTRYNKNIDYACNTLHNSFPPYKNIFCFICNPPTKDPEVTVALSCNVTGMWNQYDSEIENACISGKFSDATYPYKNIYCYICNTNEFTERYKEYISAFATPNNIFIYYLFDKLDEFSHDKTVLPAHVHDSNITHNTTPACESQFRNYEVKIDCSVPLSISLTDGKIFTSTLYLARQLQCNITNLIEHEYTICTSRMDDSTCDITIQMEKICETNGSELYIEGHNRSLSFSEFHSFSFCTSLFMNGSLVNMTSLRQYFRCGNINFVNNQYIYPLEYIFCKCCHACSTSVSNEITHASWNIFSLSFYRDCKPKEVFDSIQNKCRKIGCFPGKELRTVNSPSPLYRVSCRPYFNALQYSSPVGYTLPFSVVLDMNATYHSLELVDLLQHDLTAFNISSTICLIRGDSFNGSNVSRYYVQIDIHNFDTLITEMELLNFTSKFVETMTDHFSIMYDFKSVFQSNNTGSAPVSTPKWRPLVSKLLICPHVIFEPNEYVLSENYSVELKNYNHIFQFYQIYIDQKKRLWVCLDDFEQMTGNENVLDVVYRILMIICTCLSSIALLITFITYAVFPAIRTLPGKNVMSLVFSLLLYHILYLIEMVTGTGSDTTCKILGLLLHYFLLSSFGWFTISAIHMYKIFGTENLARVMEASHSKYLFRKYFISAFGYPVVIIFANIAVMHAVSENSLFGYGDGGKCFVSTYENFTVTVMTPMLLTCVINITLYSLTVRRLKSRPQLVSDIKDSTQIKRQDLHIFVKLFVTTGCFWILLVVNVFVDNTAVDFIIACCNSLQGLYVFIAYICTRRMYLMYKGKFVALHWLKSESRSFSTSMTSFSRLHVECTSHETRILHTESHDNTCI